MAALLRSGGTAARTAVLALFALAALLRLAVPAGWMPAGAAGLLITICTGAGPLTVRTAPDRHETPADHGSDACPFAALGVALAVPPAPLGALPAVVAPVAGIVAAAVVAVGRGLAAPPPPATGPPPSV